MSIIVEAFEQLELDCATFARLKGRLIKLEEAPNKVVPLSSCMETLNVWLNSEELTMEFTPQRQSQIKTSLKSWLSKRLALKQ